MRVGKSSKRNRDDNFFSLHCYDRWLDFIRNRQRSEGSRDRSNNVLDRTLNDPSKLRQVGGIDYSVKFFNQLDFSNWAKGLLAAFIGGGSGAFSAGLSTMAVDPKHFNIYTTDFWKVILGTFVISGLVPFFSYLHQNPLPDTKDVEHSVKIITTGNQPPTVIDIVKETSTEKKNG